MVVTSPGTVICDLPPITVALCFSLSSSVRACGACCFRHCGNGQRPAGAASVHGRAMAVYGKDTVGNKRSWDAAMTAAGSWWWLRWRCCGRLCYFLFGVSLSSPHMFTAITSNK